MKKLLLHLFCIGSALTSIAQGRLLDQSMEIRSLNVSVQSDCFTAITFLEFEFFNPRDREIEGLFHFTLAPGQAITAFQLELNGRYRDGTIEEKWKARNAYNTIVGKRIDPALLTREYGNTYRLNIYPVPAKGSRKVTITIHQLLQISDGAYRYNFALGQRDTAKSFRLSVRSVGCILPRTDDGIIANHYFISKGGDYYLERAGNNVALWQPIKFANPIKSNAYCIQEKDGKTWFALGLHHSFKPRTPLKVDKLLVYWDQSGSGKHRNIEKEISFLRQYMQKAGVKQVSIVTFSDRQSAPRSFNPKSIDWITYLQGLNYDGATRFDLLQLSDSSPDASILFSDGNITLGNRKLNAVLKPIFTVASSIGADTVLLKAITANSGGQFIDLRGYTVPEAIEKSLSAVNRLISVTSANGNAVFKVTDQGKDSLLVHGTINGEDTLTFKYGYRSRLEQEVQVVVTRDGGCKAIGIDRLSMLYEFLALSNWYNWHQNLEFGLREKVVTLNSAYIVLERVEDYVKYNIEPPKELEEACKQQGYITKDARSLKDRIAASDEFEILKGLVAGYNQRLKQWNPNSATINLRSEDLSAETKTSPGNSSGSESLQGRVSGLHVIGSESSLQEVVVTGYRTNAFSSKKLSVATGMDIESALAGRLPGVYRSGSQIRIRGTGSISGNNNPLFVVDGFPIDGNINDFVTAQEIASITVLKDVQATALYGSRGANGVILISTKKPGYGYIHERYERRPYRLKDMEDEDWLQEIRKAPVHEKAERYKQLRQDNAENPCFYIDIAQHFFQYGLIGDAERILLNAAEVAGGQLQTLRAVAYLYESWKEFAKAIDIYRHLLGTQNGNLYLHQELAWALYQDGQIQEAVNTFYSALKQKPEYVFYNYTPARSQLLAEMNAIIAIHRDSMDLSAIPEVLIRPIPADLRVVIGGNLNYIYRLEVTEPGKQRATAKNPVTLNGGYLADDVNFIWYSNEYIISKAIPGKYRITINYSDYTYRADAPSIVRIIEFKNFGRKDQTVSIQNHMMNNQDGMVEIGEVWW